MAFDLLLDELTNDLVIENGDFKFTTTVAQEVGQRVAMKLRTFEGEWFMDTQYGIPYLEQIRTARNKKEVDAILVSEIIEEPGVNYISDFTSYRYISDRLYEITATIITDEGEITIAINDKPESQWIYPIPTGGVSQDCGFGSVVDIESLLDYTNRLFDYINFSGLPANGNSTWVNKWS